MKKSVDLIELTFCLKNHFRNEIVLMKHETSFVSEHNLLKKLVEVKA